MKETLCPVCGEHHFSAVGAYEICPVCDLVDDGYQRWYPDADGCANRISLNEARRRWQAHITFFNLIRACTYFIRDPVFTDPEFIISRLHRVLLRFPVYTLRPYLPFHWQTQAVSYRPSEP